MFDVSMLSLVSYWVKGAGYVASGLSAALLTDLGCEVDESHRVIKLLYKGNVRSLVTSESLLVVGLISAILIAPWNFREIIGEGLMWGVGLLLVAPLFFMNGRIGPVSWASRDRIRKTLLVGIYRESLRLERDVVLNPSHLRGTVLCMLRGALRGNKASARHLADLARRPDGLGRHVRTAIAELCDDLPAISALLGIEFEAP